MKGLRAGSAALVAVTYGLLIFGATVRVHGAGLACPDWPLCFGQVVPELDFQVFLEWGHRALAGGVSLGFLALGGGLFRYRSQIPRATAALWGLAAVVLATQIVLGGLTVLELLAEWTVTSHLVVGNTFCALLLSIALMLAERRRLEPVAAASRVAGVGLFALILLQLALGGYVSSSNAGLVCAAWPTCDGQRWFPTWDGLVGVHVLHRTVGYGLLLSLVANAVWHGRGGALARPAWLLLVLVVAQVSLGVANVLLRLPMEVTLLHTAGGAALVLTATWFNVLAWRAPLRQVSGEWRALAAVPEAS